MSFYTPLPGYEYPRNALLNFEPLANSIGQLGQAVQKRRKEQDFNALMGGQEFSENYQSPGGWQNTVTGTRPANPMLAGINPATLALARTAGYEQGLPMLARSIEHEQDRAFREREMRLREAGEARQAQLFPTQMQEAQQNLRIRGATEDRQAKLFGPQYQEAQIAAQLKQRELDAPPLKTGTVKEDEQLYSMNTRTGDFKWVTPPNAQQNGQSKEYRKAYDKELGEAKAKAVTALPGAVDSTNAALQAARELRLHPGRQWATGAMGGVPTAPGTLARDFVVMLDQAKGQVFAEAYKSLRGGGAISDTETKQAVAALARLDRALTSKEFDAALNDYETILRNGLARAEKMAKGDYSPSQAMPQHIQTMYNKATKQWSAYDYSSNSWVTIPNAKHSLDAERQARQILSSRGGTQSAAPPPKTHEGSAPGRLPPPQAVELLRQHRDNPYVLQQFELHYGPGSATKVLGGP